MQKNSQMKVGQIWKHYKGNHYRILGIGKHSERDEELVGYQRIKDGEVYFRPFEMFFEQVEKDGVKTQRFILISDTAVGSRNLLVEIYGWYGAIGLLIAYAFISFNILTFENIWYQLLNITAALGIVTVSFYKQAYQPGFLNIVWAIVGLLALFKILL